MVACLDDVDMEDGNIVLRGQVGGLGTGIGTGVGVNPPCTCSQESDWCSWGRKCSNIECVRRPDGCGTLLLHACDGRCNE